MLRNKKIFSFVALSIFLLSSIAINITYGYGTWTGGAMDIWNINTDPFLKGFSTGSKRSLRTMDLINSLNEKNKKLNTSNKPKPKKKFKIDKTYNHQTQVENASEPIQHMWLKVFTEDLKSDFLIGWFWWTKDRAITNSVVNGFNDIIFSNDESASIKTFSLWKSADNKTDEITATTTPIILQKLTLNNTDFKEKKDITLATDNQNIYTTISAGTSFYPLPNDNDDAESAKTDNLRTWNAWGFKTMPINWYSRGNVKIDDSSDELDTKVVVFSPEIYSRSRYGIAPNGDYILPYYDKLIAWIDKAIKPEDLRKRASSFEGGEWMLNNQLAIFTAYFARPTWAYTTNPSQRYSGAWQPWIKLYSLYHGWDSQDELMLNTFSNNYLNKWVGLDKSYIALFYHSNYTTGISPIKKEIVINPKDMNDLNKPYHFGVLFHPEQSQIGNSSVVSDINELSINKFNNMAKNKGFNAWITSSQIRPANNWTTPNFEDWTNGKNGRLSWYVFPKIISETDFKEQCLWYNEEKAIEGQKYKKWKTMHEILKGSVSQTNEVAEYRTCTVRISWWTKDLFEILKKGADGKYPLTLEGNQDSIKNVALTFKYYAFDNYKIVPPGVSVMRNGFTWNKFVQFTPSQMPISAKVETKNSWSFNVSNVIFPIYQVTISSAGDKCFTQLAAAQRGDCYDTTNGRWIAWFGHFLIVKDGENMVDSLYKRNGGWTYTPIVNQDVYMITPNYTPRFDNYILSSKLNYDIYGKESKDSEGVQYFNGQENNISISEMQEWKAKIKINDLVNNELNVTVPYINRPEYILKEPYLTTTTIGTKTLTNSSYLDSVESNFLTGLVGMLYNLHRQNKLGSDLNSNLFKEFNANFAYSYNSSWLSSQIKNDPTRLGYKLFNNAWLYSFKMPTWFIRPQTKWSQSQGEIFLYQGQLLTNRMQDIIWKHNFVGSLDGFSKNIVSMIIRNQRMFSTKKPETYVSMYEYDSDNIQATKGAKPHSDNTVWYMVAGAKDIIYPFFLPIPFIESVPYADAKIQNLSTVFDTWDNFFRLKTKAALLTNLGFYNNNHKKTSKIWPLTIKLPDFGKDYQTINKKQIKGLLNKPADLVSPFSYNFRKLHGIVGEYYSNGKLLEIEPWKVLSNGIIKTNVPKSSESRNDIKITNSITFRPIGASGNSNYKFYYGDVVDLVFRNILFNNSSTVYEGKRLPIYRWTAASLQDEANKLGEKMRKANSDISMNIDLNVQNTWLPSSLYTANVWSFNVREEVQKFVNNMVKQDANSSESQKMFGLTLLYQNLNIKDFPSGSTKNWKVLISNPDNWQNQTYNYSCTAKPFNDVNEFLGRVIGVPTKKGSEDRFVRFPVVIEWLRTINGKWGVVYECNYDWKVYTLFGDFQLPHYLGDTKNDLSFDVLHGAFKYIINNHLMLKSGKINGTLIFEGNKLPEQRDSEDYYISKIVKDYFNYFTSDLSDPVDNNNQFLFFSNYDTNIWNGVVYNNSYNFGGGEQKVPNHLYTAPIIWEDISYNFLETKGSIKKPLNVQQIVNTSNMTMETEEKYDSLKDKEDYYLSLLNLNNTFALREIEESNDFYDYSKVVLDITDADKSKFFTADWKLTNDFKESILNQLENKYEKLKLEAWLNSNIAWIASQFVDGLRVSPAPWKKEQVLNNVLVSYVNIPNTKADYDLLIPYGIFLTEKEIFIDNVKKNILRVNFIPIDIIPFQISDGRVNALINSILWGDNMKWADDYVKGTKFFHRLWVKSPINVNNLSHVVNYFNHQFYPDNVVYKSAFDEETDGGQEIPNVSDHWDLNSINDKRLLDVKVFSSSFLSIKKIPENNPKPKECLKNPDKPCFAPSTRDLMVTFLSQQHNNKVYKESWDTMNSLYMAGKYSTTNLLSELFKFQTKTDKSYIVAPESLLGFIDLSIYKFKYDLEEIKNKTVAPYIFDDDYFDYNTVIEERPWFKEQKIFKDFTNNFKCENNPCFTTVKERDAFQQKLFPAGTLKNNQKGKEIIPWLKSISNLPEDMQPMVFHTKKIIPYTVDYNKSSMQTIQDYEKNKKEDKFISYSSSWKEFIKEWIQSYYYNQFNGVVVFWKGSQIQPKPTKEDKCYPVLVYANETSPNTISPHILNGDYTDFERTFGEKYKNGISFNWNNFTGKISNSIQKQWTNFKHQLKVFLLPESRDDCDVTLDHVLVTTSNMKPGSKIWDNTPITPSVRKILSPIKIKKWEIKTLPPFETTIVEKKPWASIRVTLYWRNLNKKTKVKEDNVTNTVDLNYIGKRWDIPWEHLPPNDPKKPDYPFPNVQYKNGCGICRLEPVIPSHTQLVGTNYIVDFANNSEINPIVQLVCHNNSSTDITKINYNIQSTKNMVGFNELWFIRWVDNNSLLWSITWLKKWQTVLWHGAEKNVDPSLLKRYVIEDNLIDLKASVNGTYDVHYENNKIVSCDLNDITYNKTNDKRQNTLQCYLTKDKETTETASFDFSKQQTKGHMYFKLYKGQQDEVLFKDPVLNTIRDIATYRLSTSKMYLNPISSSDNGIITSSRVKGYLLGNQSRMVAEYNQISFIWKITFPESVKPRFDEIKNASLFKGLRDRWMIDWAILDFKCKYDWSADRNVVMAYTADNDSWSTYGNQNYTWKYKGCVVDISVRFKQNPYGLDTWNSFRPNSLWYKKHNIIGKVPSDVNLMTVVQNGQNGSTWWELVEEYKTSIPYTSLCSKNSSHTFCKYITPTEFLQKKHGYVLWVQAQEVENDLAKNAYAFFDNIDSSQYKTLHNGKEELYSNVSLQAFVEWWFPIEITKTVSSAAASGVINKDASWNKIQNAEQIECSWTLTKEKAVYSYIDTSRRETYMDYEKTGGCGYEKTIATYFKYINLEGFLPNYLWTYNARNEINNWKTRNGTCSCWYKCVASWTKKWYDKRNRFGYTFPYIRPTDVKGTPTDWPKETIDEQGNPNFQNVLKYRWVQKIPNDNPANSTFLIQVGNNNWTQLIWDFQLNKTSWRKDDVSALNDTNNKLLKEGLGNFIIKNEDAVKTISYTGNKTKYLNEYYIPLIDCLPFDFNKNQFSNNANANYKVDDKGQCPDGRKPLFYKILTDQGFNQKYINEDILTKFNQNWTITFDKSKYQTYIYNNSNSISNNKPFIGSPDTKTLQVDGLGAIFFSEKLKNFEQDTLENTSKTKVYLTSNIEKKSPTYTINQNGTIDKKTANGLVLVVNGDLYIGKNVSLIEAILIVNWNVYVEDSQYQLNIYGKTYIAWELVNHRKSVAYSDKDVLTNSYERPSIRVFDDKMWDMIWDYPLINSILIDKESYKENEMW